MLDGMSGQGRYCCLGGCAFAYYERPEATVALAQKKMFHWPDARVLVMYGGLRRGCADYHSTGYVSSSEGTMPGPSEPGA